jgi:hypothetical protein
LSDDAHEHKWQPNGQVREHAEASDPVSHLYDTLYTKVFSVMVCECGATKRVHVANENVRERRMDRR